MAYSRIKDYNDGGTLHRLSISPEETLGIKYSFDRRHLFQAEKRLIWCEDMYRRTGCDKWRRRIKEATKQRDAQEVGS